MVARTSVVRSTTIYVNTWPTTNTPWVVVHELTGAGFEASEETVVFLSGIVEKLRNLPVRVRLPKYLSELSLPRYYAVYLSNLADFEIVDVIGVRRDGRPTKWSYRLGYWHPTCTWKIISAIEREIEDIKSKLQQAQEQKAEA